MNDLAKIEKKAKILLTCELFNLNKSTIEQWFKDSISFYEEEWKLRNTLEDYENMKTVDDKIKSLKEARVRYYTQLAEKSLYKQTFVLLIVIKGWYFAGIGILIVCTL